MPKRSLHPIQVLVIDDNEMDNELYGYFLRRDPVCNYQVEAVFTAEQARTFLKSNWPDCIILDYHLPDTQGLSFLDELLAADKDRCIVMLTGDSGGNLPLEALKHGAADYLDKSECNPSVLARAVRYALERHKAKLESIKLARDIEQVQEMNNLQREFGALASHEIRSAIATIHTSLRLLERHSEDKMRLTTYSGRINEACTRILHLSDNTLKLSEIEHRGEVDYRPIQFSLRNMMESLMEEFRSMHQERQFRCDLKAVPEQFRGDPNLCQQMFSNLLSNAVKYSPGGKPVEIDSSDTPNGFEIRVRDEGIGIPPEDMKKLFTKFYRADNAKSIGGTGLGLHLTRMLAERHNGSIDVESEPGRGTTFVVKLPKVA